MMSETIAAPMAVCPMSRSYEVDRVVDAVCSVQDGPAVVVDLVAYPGRGAVALAVNVAQYNKVDPMIKTA